METLASAVNRSKMFKLNQVPPSPRRAAYSENQSQGSTTNPPAPAYRCNRCKDAGHFYPDVDAKDSAFGKAVKCWACYDFLGRSRLTPAEQAHTIDDLLPRADDTGKHVTAMKFLCREMLREPFGFLSFQGSFGDGKSLALTALVAEFCRKRVQAQYWHIEDLLKLIMPFQTELDGEQVTQHEIDNRYHFLHTVPVLAIDEPDKAVWSDWKAGKIGELIDYRHRHAETLVTLFAMNKPPEQWAGAERVGHLNSRLRDGLFNRAWDSRYTLPPCLRQFTRLVAGKQQHYAPGFFVVNLPDARPNLVRETQ